MNSFKTLIQSTHKLFISIAAISLLSSTSALAENHSKKPNVLFILIDDFGWHDVAYNGNTFYETPEIDRLSKEWMRFDYCYTPSPMCSPTRLSILTGKNPARHGVTQWLKGSDRAYLREGEKPRVYCPLPLSSGIQESEITLGEMFKDSGYQTAFFGKWHMGALQTTGGPANHGYESQKAVIESNSCSMFYPFRNNNYFPNAKKGDNFTDLLTDAAIEFVSTKREKPFYLHLSHFAMHAPIGSKPKLRKKFLEKRKSLPKIKKSWIQDKYAHQPQKFRADDAEYAGELATLDHNIGRLIKTLKSIGEYENTIIVLTGDNGGRTTKKIPHATSIQPLRAGKTFLFEGGLRTPLLIHWPGHSKPGMTSKSPVTSMDFYPTLLEMANITPSPAQQIDGASLVPLFKGDSLKRDSFYWHFPHYQKEGSYPGSAIRKGDFKLIHNYHQDDLLLFNVIKDPNETKNLAPSMPQKAAELDRQLMAYLKKVGAHIPQKIEP